MFELIGKTAVVTGASRGIGAAIAMGLAKSGADVAVMSRNLTRLREVAGKIIDMGRQAVAVKADIGVSEDIDAAVEGVLKHFKGVDILVNNAGISPVLKRAEEMTKGEWEEIVKINLTGTFLCAQAFGRVMIKQKAGKIINMTSVGGAVGFPRQVAYCATKGAIIQLTKVLALDWAKHNIQVNAVGPSYIETDLTEGVRKSKIISEDLLKKTPMGRFGKPEEVVGAVVFLASPAASYMTGETTYVDGGWLAL
jgi:NAD(P)-dependent dehydrogenase (short-subunit alcohol dehydrogenase family)